MDESDYIKPTIIAPGGEYDVHSCGFFDTCYDYYSLDVVNSDSDYSALLGTSFAAPQVSGSIALMMEYEPSLATSPHRIIALLTAGANVDSLSSQTMQSSSGLSKQSGSGLMDLSETFEMLDYARWDTYSCIGSAPMLIVIDEIYFESGREVRISHAYLRNQIEYDTTDDNFDDALNLANFDIEIYNSSGQLIESCTTSLSNVEIVDFIVPSTGTYTIKIRYRSDNGSTNVYLGAIAIKGNTFISSC